MTTLPETSYKKATQALNFFAQKKDGKINKMKAIKLIYLADRLHLRKYGRPVVGDKYLAMKYGPVGSQTKRAAELDVSGIFLQYTRKYIKPTEDENHFMSLKPVEFDLFSETDLECLELVYIAFGDKDQFELAELTHQYPEWKKHEKELKSGKKRVAMNYDDFFEEAEKQDIIFSQKKNELLLSKHSFEEAEEVSNFFSS